MPKHSKNELESILKLEQFPRSGNYDPGWVIENLMGPNVLWLTEALTKVMSLESGMRILDMGCGKAVSSIFLAKEFGVQVWATDLWIAADSNWRRVAEAGLDQTVFPIHSEAHMLPYPENFFDAMVSMDAYHYFGTDDLYLSYYSRFAKPNAQIGIVVPGLREEFAKKPPEHLAAKWTHEYWTLHSPKWWREHWEKSGTVEVEVADLVPDGWRQWLRWLEVCRDEGAPTDPNEIEMLRVDEGRNLGFTRLVARRKPQLPPAMIPQSTGTDS